MYDSAANLKTSAPSDTRKASIFLQHSKFEVPLLLHTLACHSYTTLRSLYFPPHIFCDHIEVNNSQFLESNKHAKQFPPLLKRSVTGFGFDQSCKPVCVCVCVSVCVCVCVCVCEREREREREIPHFLMLVKPCRNICGYLSIAVSLYCISLHL